jgi:hypothetical protein
MKNQTNHEVRAMPWIYRYPGIGTGLNTGRRYSVGAKPLSTIANITTDITAKNGSRETVRARVCVITDSRASTSVVIT